MLELINLDFQYPSTDNLALKNINLTLSSGECIGLLGVNGAGKTTLLSIISRLIKPSRGQIKHSTTCNIAITPQHLAFYHRLKVKENIELFADLYRITAHNRKQLVDELIETVQLEKLLNKYAGQLSGGQQRRLNFLLGVMQDADLYLFDEASVGVDSSNRLSILRYIEKLKAQGKSIIFTSHYLKEVETLATRIVLLNDGQIQLDQKMHDLNNQSKNLFIQWQDSIPSSIIAACSKLKEAVHLDKNSLLIENIDPTQFQNLQQTLSLEDCMPCTIRYEHTSLEQLYLKMTGGIL